MKPERKKHKDIKHKNFHDFEKSHISAVQQQSTLNFQFYLGLIMVEAQ